MIKINNFEIYQSCKIDDEIGSVWFIDYLGIPSGLGSFYNLRAALAAVLVAISNHYHLRLCV